MKKIFIWLIFFFFPLSLLAWLSNLFLGPAHFRLNDDAIISKLASLENNFSQSAITVHTSINYAQILNFLSINYPAIAWNGVLQIAVFIFVMSILNFFIGFEKFIPIQIRFSLIFLNSLYLFWYTAKPTFTMTSIGIGIMGLTLLMISFWEVGKKKQIAYFAVAVFAQLASFLIRPDGYYLALLLSVGIILYFLIFVIPRRKNLIFLTINILIMILIVSFNNKLLEDNLTQSRAWTKYYKFQDEFFKIKTNPAETVMYELIAEGKVKGLDWDNVDTIILQSNSFYDEEVFSAENLALGTSQIEDSLGFSGIQKRGFSNSLDRTLSYLEESKYFFYGFMALFLLAFFLKIVFWKRLLIFLVGVAPILSTFFYLGAASRLPLRVHLPALLFILILWVVFISFNGIKNQKILSWVFSISILILAQNFILFNNNIFMVKQDNAKLAINLEVNQNKMKNVNENGVFIGQIMAFPENATLAYSKMKESEVSYLTSGWHTFSPPWYEDLYELNLIEDNPYLAMASQPGVYWVSDFYTAQVLNMYMNNHEIIRKNLCLLDTLPYDLGIYTFQSEEVCFN